MSKNEYRKYLSNEITKELLDTIQVGALIKFNNLRKPMRVKGVSENFFVMVQKQFKDTYYSVFEKKQWDGYIHNEMIGGMFHCGRDNWIFGSPTFDYNFDDEKAVVKYLDEFETEKTELSHRNAVAVHTLYIKSKA